MSTVGVKELKNQLSRYLREVKRGQEVIVTERGKVFARIIPDPVPAQDSVSKALHELALQGIAVLPQELRRGDRPAPIQVDGKPISEIVREDRR
jgi:prevent-host-death family protein